MSRRSTNFVHSFQFFRRQKYIAKLFFVNPVISCHGSLSIQLVFLSIRMKIFLLITKMRETRVAWIKSLVENGLI